MQTGDLEFELDKTSIADAVDRVSSVQTIEEDIAVSGYFRGATLDTWHFDFRAEDGRSITGRLNVELSEERVREMLMLTNLPSEARLKVTTITTRSGAVRRRFELLDLAPRGEQKQQVTNQQGS